MKTTQQEMIETVAMALCAIAMMVLIAALSLRFGSERLMLLQILPFMLAVMIRKEDRKGGKKTDD